MDDPAVMRATKAAMAETGVGVLDIEFVKITPEIDVAALEPFVAAGAELGARHVITAPYDPDLARLADRLGAISRSGRALRAAAPCSSSSPGRSCRISPTALRVVEASGPGRDRHPGRHAALRPLGQHATSSSTRIPPARLPFVHVCDAPVQEADTTEGLLHAARAERLPPGEGGLDIRAFSATCRPTSRSPWRCR